LSPDPATTIGGVDTHPGGLAAYIKEARSACTVSRRWVSGLAGPPGLTPAPTPTSTRPPEIWSAVGTRASDYLPAALAANAHRAAPESLVVGDGLDQIPIALDRIRRGVSAQKLVVRV